MSVYLKRKFYLRLVLWTGGLPNFLWNPASCQMKIILYSFVETSLMLMEKISKEWKNGREQRKDWVLTDREKMTEISWEKQVDIFVASKEAAYVEHCHPGCKRMSGMHSWIRLGMHSLGMEVLGKILFQRQSERKVVGDRGMNKLIELEDIISKDCGTQELTLEDGYFRAGLTELWLKARLHRDEPG